MGQGSSEIQALQAELQKQLAEMWRVINLHGALIEGMRSALAGRRAPAEPDPDADLPGRPVVVTQAKKRGTVKGTSGTESA
jgi:hypothetical protein